MLTGTDIFHAFQVFAVAQAVLFLMNDGLLLAPYRRFLEKKQFEWRKSWAVKPLGLCDTCFTGQVSLWWGLFLFGAQAGLNPLEIGVKTLLFVSFNLFLFEVKIWAWQTRNNKGQ